MWKPGEQRAHGLRCADDPKRDPRRDPERSLGSDDHAEEIRTVRIERLTAKLDDLAVGEDEGQAGDVVRREAVLQAMRAAGVLRDVASDRAHLLARRIRCVEEALCRDGARDVEIRDAGLDDDALTREVDLEDPVHPCERHDDAACHGRRTAGEAGARPARDERDLLAVAGAEYRLHVLRRAGKNDELRNRAVPRQAVALIDAELLRLGDDMRCAERVPKR